MSLNRKVRGLLTIENFHRLPVWYHSEILKQFYRLLLKTNITVTFSFQLSSSRLIGWSYYILVWRKYSSIISRICLTFENIIETPILLNLKMILLRYSSWLVSTTVYIILVNEIELLQWICFNDIKQTLFFLKIGTPSNYYFLGQ